MVWFVPLMMAGMSLAGGMKEKGQAETARATDESNTRVQNTLRKANNELAGAQSSLAYYMQARQNRLHLQNTGDAIEAVTTNINRLVDQSTKGALSRRVSAAEEAGALSARLGAMGGRAGTAQMLNSTISLRADLVDEMADTQLKQQTYDMGLQRDVFKDQMILGLSDVRYNAPINQMEVQSSNIQVPSTAAVVGNAALTFMQSYSQLSSTMKTTTQPSAIPVIDKGIPATGGM